jgi:hypothetical protein
MESNPGHLSGHGNPMTNTRRFLSEKTALQIPLDIHLYGPHIYADCCQCLAQRKPIRTIVYPCVLNRKRRAARQLL